MKQVILCGLFFFLINTSWSQKKNIDENYKVIAKVDPRVEIMAILARMAGLGGYDSKAFKVYINDVEKHFAKDSLHPAVLHLKELGKKHYLGFDAVMRMAIHLNYPSFTPKVKFTATVPEARWTKEGAEKFIPLLKQFYTDTNFDSFFKAHKNLYNVAEKRFQVLVDQADFDWFPRFYGYKPEGKFSVYLGLLNGNFSYGPKVEYPDGKEEFYGIMSNYQTDAEGMPLYDAKIMLPTVIHEFNHSFINHIIIKDSLALKPFGEKIHAGVSKQMIRNYYTTWTNSLSESLVRAAVIRYEIEHDTTRHNVAKSVETEYNLGFYWIEDLISLMGVYEKSKNQYPTFVTFMPVIKIYLNDLANNLTYKQRKYEEKKPKIIAVLPFENGATDVDPSIKEMKIIFSRPLVGWSFRYSDLGKEHYPLESVAGWDETNTQLTLKLNLKPDWNYEMVIMGQGLRTKDGHALEDVLFKFKTK